MKDNLFGLWTNRPTAGLVWVLALTLTLLAACAPTTATGANTAATLPQRRAAGPAEVVATFPELMPTGVTVAADGRTFVNFPRWEEGVPYTVAELVDGEAVPYPDLETNRLDESAPDTHFISVQSVVVGPDDRLWVLDTGRPLFNTPPVGPKLVAINLDTNQIEQTISFSDSAAVLDTTYLNDVRFDLRSGAAGTAFITDSSSLGPNALIVVDLATGEAFRQLEGDPSVSAVPNFLPVVEGRVLLSDPADEPPSYLGLGADGIAITDDALFYRPLASRRLYSVPLDLLADPGTDPQTLANAVTDYGDLGFASDGLESDTSGRIYLTNYEDGAVLRFTPDAPLGDHFETLLYNAVVIWPDTLSLAADGSLYLTVNQLNRQPTYHNGEDLRRPPYKLIRIATDAEPVRLQ